MTRDEAIAQGATAIQQSLNQAIGLAFDAGSASVPQQGGGQFAQSDIDAAIAKVTADDASHMQELQKQVDLDQSDMVSLKSSMKEALSHALSMLSPGPDSTATQQVPGVVSPVAQKPVDEAVAAQTAGPLPDQNSGTNSAPAVSNTGTDPQSQALTDKSTAPQAANAPAPVK